MHDNLPEPILGDVDDGVREARSNVTKKYKKRAEVNTAILANHALPVAHRQSWVELAKRLEVPVAVFYEQINRLRKKGLIPLGDHQMSVTGPRAEPGKNAVPSNFDPDELLQKVMRGEYVNEADRRKVLGAIIALGSDATKIRATEVLNDMDSAKESGIGPPPPLTPDEIAHRLSILMCGCGQEITKKAEELAFGKAESETPTNPQS